MLHLGRVGQPTQGHQRPPLNIVLCIGVIQHLHLESVRLLGVRQGCIVDKRGNPLLAKTAFLPAQDCHHQCHGRFLRRTAQIDLKPVAGARLRRRCLLKKF